MKNNLAEIVVDEPGERRLVLVSAKDSTAASFGWLQGDRTLYLLGSLLITLQVADAYLTALGVYHFGVQAEGNLLLRSLMELLGYIPALALTKGFAVAVIFGLGCYSQKVSWLPCAFLVLIGVYLSAAIIPWTYILVRFV